MKNEQRILVTGGAGFVGSHVVDICLERGYTVGVVDNFSTGAHRHDRNVHEFQVDIRTAELEYVFEQFRPSCVIHLAANSNVPASIADPVHDAQVNVSGTVHVLECARKYEVRRVVYASSAAVYGNPQTLPLTEDSPIKPLSPYGQSKYSGEQYVHLYAALHGLCTVALRFANVYGPRQSPQTEAGVIPIFVQAVLAGETPIIYGDGEQTRDFIFVRDVAEAVLGAAEQEVTGCFHVSSAQAVSVKALLAQICTILEVPMQAKYATMKDGDIHHSCLSNERAKRVLGWAPRTTLTEGLQQTIHYHT